MFSVVTLLCVAPWFGACQSSPQQELETPIIPDDDDATDDDDGSAGEQSGDDTLWDMGDPTGGGDDDDDSTLSKAVDLLVVIDNSGSMGEEQANLARNFPNLIQQLRAIEEGGENANVDVNIMITTTDLGNSRCPATTPEGGDPVTTGCNAKIAAGEFAANGDSPDASAACTDVCQTDVLLDDERPFIWFRGSSDNVEDVAEADVNGDGVPDDAVAQSLACLGPQGIQGCGLESPLEAMMQALDPNAAHNKADKPFLRKGAMLAIVIMTDEADCSIDEGKHPEVFADDGGKEFWEINPETDAKAISSAICWNAGVECTGTSPYDCQSRPDDETNLRPLGRYKNYLNSLIDSDKEVVMLGIVGIPKVTAHAEEPPFQPTEGGVFDLEYRDWVDDVYPTGDVLPPDWDADPRRGAEYQEFAFGIGPGCTGVTASGDFTGQAVPPRRIRDVCESLNRPAQGDDPEKIRCCMESICDEDFSHAIDCLTGLVEVTPVPE